MVAVRVRNDILASKLSLIPICSSARSDHCFTGLNSSFCSRCLSIHLCVDKVNQIRMNYIKTNEGYLNSE